MNKKSGGAFEASLINDDWPEIEQVVVRPVRRTLSLVSMLLIVAALGADCVGRAHVRRGSIRYIESYAHGSRGNEYADLGMDELALAEFDQAAELEKDAHLKWNRASRFAQAGLVLFVLALGCFGISRCVGEREPSFPFLVFSIAYILLFMLIVG
jgi:hypothetical protein